MSKCLPNCQCGRHNSYVRTPEMRRRASAQMTVEWAGRQADPEVMSKISAALSAGHEARWTDERRAAVREIVGRLHTPEVLAKKSESQRGKWHGRPAVGYSDGQYRSLTMQYDHPLASGHYVVTEHRKVLYDKIGPGPHECHWNETYGCGQVELDWGGLDGICVDHLDGDEFNNDPENLVQSCNGCNIRRGSSHLTADSVRQIRGLHNHGVSQKSLAELFDVSQPTVSMIVNGKSWGHL